MRWIGRATAAAEGLVAFHGATERWPAARWVIALLSPAGEVRLRVLGTTLAGFFLGYVNDYLGAFWIRRG